MIKISNDRDFEKYASMLTYRFAKTYAHFAPHEYAIAENGTEELEIIRALNKYIQENYENEEFMGKVYQVIFVGQHKYWSMEYWANTNILNRNWDFKDKNGNINKSITDSYKRGE